jgi:hypothetical protein
VVTTTVGANDPTNEWNIGGTCTSVSTVGANCIGGNFQGFRTAGNAAVWGALVEARDATDQTSNAGKGVVGMELDFGANLADNAANGAIIGHAGVRIGLDMVLYRYNGVDTAQTQGAVGLWFTTSTFSGGAGDTHTNYGSMIGAAVNTQAYSVLDARGTIAPTGSVNPVYGVNMDAGQAIEFKGDDTTLSPAPQRTLLYTGSALSYQVSAVTKFSISDTGGVTAVGLPATAGSSGLYVCVDSVGVLYKKSACP